MRSRFESQLEDLQKDMVFMGALCEKIINCSLEGLNGPESLDQERIQQTYLQIEELERDIEARCIKLLLRQQPVARDLRTVSSALKMVYDMKRIGAQSSEIADLINKAADKITNTKSDEKLYDDFLKYFDEEFIDYFSPELIIPLIVKDNLFGFILSNGFINEHNLYVDTYSMEYLEGMKTLLNSTLSNTLIYRDYKKKSKDK